MGWAGGRRAVADCVEGIEGRQGFQNCASPFVPLGSLPWRGDFFYACIWVISTIGSSRSSRLEASARRIIFGFEVDCIGRGMGVHGRRNKGGAEAIGMRLQSIDERDRGGRSGRERAWNAKRNNGRGWGTKRNDAGRSRHTGRDFYWEVDGVGGRVYGGGLRAGWCRKRGWVSVVTM
jgi:hypothetical protein